MGQMRRAFHSEPFLREVGLPSDTDRSAASHSVSRRPSPPPSRGQALTLSPSQVQGGGEREIALPARPNLWPHADTSARTTGADPPAFWRWPLPRTSRGCG